jgi:hypothetical protein
MDVTKPIIHITSNVLMSVDLAVVIRAGRPWYAYPLPDDFAVSVDLFDDGQNPRSVPLAQLDRPAIRRLTDIREGYPWLLPHHRSAGTTGTGPAWSPHNEIVGPSGSNRARAGGNRADGVLKVWHSSALCRVRTSDRFCGDCESLVRVGIAVRGADST